MKKLFIMIIFFLFALFSCVEKEELKIDVITKTLLIKEEEKYQVEITMNYYDPDVKIEIDNSKIVDKYITYQDKLFHVFFKVAPISYPYHEEEVIISSLNNEVKKSIGSVTSNTYNLSNRYQVDLHITAHELILYIYNDTFTPLKVKDVKLIFGNKNKVNLYFLDKVKTINPFNFQEIKIGNIDNYQMERENYLFEVTLEQVDESEKIYLLL